MQTVLAPTASPASIGAPRRTPSSESDRRRANTRELGDWLAAALDELDYGVLLVGADAEIVYRNHAAATELGADHPLRCEGRFLRAVDTADAVALRDALRSARSKRLRRLVWLGAADVQVGVSVVPLASGTTDDDAAAEAPTLLVLGKRQVCETLSVQAFARSHGLTAAETRVLNGLCSGLAPSGIAASLGVAVSTIRTQIGTLRVKTGAASIRALVGQVARLPPLRGALRQANAAPAPRLSAVASMPRSHGRQAPVRPC